MADEKEFTDRMVTPMIPEMKTALSEISHWERCTMSELIRALVTNYIVLTKSNTKYKAVTESAKKLDEAHEARLNAEIKSAKKEAAEIIKQAKIKRDLLDIKTKSAKKEAAKALTYARIKRDLVLKKTRLEKAEILKSARLKKAEILKSARLKK